jgi:hypothetical protein
LFNKDDGDIVQTAKDPPPTWSVGKLTWGEQLPWSKDKQGNPRSPWTLYAPFRDLPKDQTWPDWYCCQCKKHQNKNFHQVVKIRYCHQTYLLGGSTCRHEACKDCNTEPWPVRKVPKWWCCQCRDYRHGSFQEPLTIEECDRKYRTAVPFKSWHSKCEKFSSTGDQQWINDRSGMYSAS